MVFVLGLRCYDLNAVKLVIKFPLVLCCTICLFHITLGLLF